MIESSARQNECRRAIEPNPCAAAAEHAIESNPRAPSAGRVGAYRVTISLAASPPRLSASQPNPDKKKRNETKRNETKRNESKQNRIE